MLTMNPSEAFWYFAAGALVPTLAYGLLLRNNASQSASLSTRDPTKSLPKARTADASPDSNDNEDDNSDEEDSDDDQHVDTNGPSTSWGMTQAPYKMLLCVNTELRMGKGKMAAQCGHAAVGCYQRAMRHCPNAVRAWERTGCAKIAVQCASAHEFEELVVHARARGIPWYLVEDAGRTQIAAGSRTVLGLGPAPVSVFVGVTDHLKLL
jgi:peptidyl-tRNA hydrolase, PTH2 family